MELSPHLQAVTDILGDMAQLEEEENPHLVELGNVYFITQLATALEVLPASRCLAAISISESPNSDKTVLIFTPLISKSTYERMAEEELETLDPPSLSGIALAEVYIDNMELQSNREMGEDFALGILEIMEERLDERSLDTENLRLAVLNKDFNIGLVFQDDVNQYDNINRIKIEDEDQED